MPVATKTSKIKGDRIDLRVDEAAKKLIERAASIAGVSVTAFTLSTVVRAAREEIAAYERLTLSDRDRDRFLTAMEGPPNANGNLRAAMKQYAARHLTKTSK